MRPITYASVLNHAFDGNIAHNEEWYLYLLTFAHYLKVGRPNGLQLGQVIPICSEDSVRFRIARVCLCRRQVRLKKHDAIDGDYFVDYLSRKSRLINEYAVVTYDPEQGYTPYLIGKFDYEPTYSDIVFGFRLKQKMDYIPGIDRDGWICRWG